MVCTASVLIECRQVDDVDVTVDRLVPRSTLKLRTLIMHSRDVGVGSDLVARLDRIEGLLRALIDRETVREYYSTDEFARSVGKAEFTVREWCRRGRIAATKRACGRGRHCAWAISHDELIRFQRDGLRLAGGRQADEN